MNNYETALKVMADKNADDEIKIYLVLELLYNGEVSLTKAKELMYWAWLVLKIIGLLLMRKL